MDRIITYSLEEDFIKNVADFVGENFLKANKDISRLAFVFGGKRPSLFLKRELAKKVKKNFFPSRFFSIDEFFEYILSRKEQFKKITDLDACFTIYNIAKDVAPGILKDRENFSSFLPWCREILSFIEQLDLEDIKKEVLKSIQINAVIGYDVYPNINKLLQNIVFIRDAYNDVLIQKKTYSRGLIYLLASEYIKEIELDEFDGILFCNLFYLHKTEEKVIKNIFDRGKSFLFFQGNQKDWDALEKVSKSFSCEIKPMDCPNFSEKNGTVPNIEIFSGFDGQSQVCLVREVLKKINNPDKTVIVLPEPDNIVPLLSEIASLVKEINVSAGYPLKRNLIYSLLEDIFKAQNTKKTEEYYSRDYLRLINHPLIKNLKILSDPSITRIIIHKIEEVLIGIEESPLGGSLFVKLKDIEDLKYLYDISASTVRDMNIKLSYGDIEVIVRELHSLLFYSWENINNFYELSITLERFLDCLVKNSFLGNYQLNLKIVKEIFSIKEELKNLFFNKEQFPKEDIFKIFKNKIDSEKVSFSGSPLKGLQVLGLFETRSLNFENVIIMDANESILPKLRIYEPLIPREVMLNLGLDRIEKEEEIQRYQFMRLVSGAKNVYIIYEESEKKERSRFVEELIWNKQSELNSLDVIPVTKANFKLNILPKKIQISKNQDIINFLKDFRYSATSLNTYINCPLKFYYQFVLGLEEKEDLLEEPEGVDIGRFVHELLEKTFRIFIGRKPIIDEKFRKKFFIIMNEDFETTFSKRMKSDSFLLKEILKIRLDQFLEQEKERNIREILFIEEGFEKKIRLNGKDFNFKCIIDRIDRLFDGSILIIDYKTGSVESMPKSIDKIEGIEFSRESIKNNIRSFQLPLYFYFVSKIYKNDKLDTALYYLKNTALKEYLKENKNDPDIKEKLIGLLIKALESVISEILDLKIVFNADDSNANYCKNCSFSYLCR